jgi:hypothetical protein
MLGERRGRGDYGRATTWIDDEMTPTMQTREDTNQHPVLRRDRVATAAVLLAIVVSLAGACVVIVEAATESPAHKHITIATAE